MVRLASLFVFLLLMADPGWAQLPVNPFVMGPPVVSVTVRAEFLHGMNPGVDLASALNYSLLYDEEASAEGVNPDLAFCQMLLETSYLRFGGQVRPGQNNFSGLGALDGGDKGLVFPTPRLGIRAQVQHLKYYATTLPLAGASVNPRLSLVKRGSAPTAWQLSQAWASDPDYGRKLLALMARMVAYAQQFAPGNPRNSVQAMARPPVPGN
jgi:hypothetical protein